MGTTTRLEGILSEYRCDEEKKVGIIQSPVGYTTPFTLPYYSSSLNSTYRTTWTANDEDAVSSLLVQFDGKSANPEG